VTRASFDPRTYWDRRLDRTWSLQGVGLVGVSRSYNTWLYRVRDRIFQRMIARTDVDPRGAKVLDVAVGVGFYTERWLAMGAELTGIDIADSSIRRLALRHPEARFERLDISDDVEQLGAGYHLIDAFDVLFHVVDDERHRRAMRNIHSLLRPGGWLVFTDLFAQRRSSPTAHYVRRSRAEIEDAVLAAGFEIVSRRPAFVLMNYPFDSNRWHRHLWSKVLAPLQRREATGWLLGALLYGPELLLTRWLRESPTTEVMLCRRPLTATEGRR
jgi:2-polyprenyl-3-methyl-5-hydroxy-6-metoxy-1,4-benzoquinol methylase